MEASSIKPNVGKELAFRKFLANALSLFAFACLCYFVIALGLMWFYAWQNNMYPFTPQRSMNPPWNNSPVFDRGFDHCFKASMLAFAATVISGVLITNWRAAILLGSTVFSWIVLIMHVLSLSVD
jgi:sterol desaturase/sphingolipid hydroxylase (fatty acid hydroxylase superfamily)